MEQKKSTPFSSPLINYIITQQFLQLNYDLLQIGL